MIEDCSVFLNFNDTSLSLLSPLPYNDTYVYFSGFLPKTMTQQSGKIEVSISVSALSTDFLFTSQAGVVQIEESNIPNAVWQKLPAQPTVRFRSNTVPVAEVYSADYSLNNDIPFFEINNRTIAVPPNIVDIVAQGDTNSRTVSFQMPRYFDGVDLSQKYICINFKTSSGTSGYTHATNITANVDNIIDFDWVIDGKSTKDSGTLSFSVECYGVDTSDNKIYRWQTKPSIINITPTIQPLNNAISRDYSLEKEFVSNNDNTTTLEEMVDSDAPIQITGRTIIMPSMQDITVSQDANSQIMTFTMARYFDGMDLSTKIVSIKYINAANKGDRCPVVNSITSDSEITFGWILDGGVTYKSGVVKFAIEFLGYNEKNDFYAWSTLPSQFTVSQGLDVDSIIEPPSPTWLQTWTIESQEILDLMDATISSFVEVTVEEQIQRVIDEGDRQVARVVEAFSGSGEGSGVTQEDVDVAITTHNNASNSHNDIRTLVAGKLDSTGSANALTSVFTTADTRTNISSGSTISKIFGTIHKFFSDLKNVAFTGNYADLSNKPEALRNPYELAFSGAVNAVYDGSSFLEVNIPLGGSGSEWTYYDKTPCRLSGSSIGGAKIVSSEECSYRAYSDTVKDMESQGINYYGNLARDTTKDYYEFVLNSAATAWYSVFFKMTLTGLEVGKVYKIYVNTIGLLPGSTTSTMMYGQFLLASVVDGSKGDTILSPTRITSAGLHGYEFTPTTTDVILEYYPGNVVEELVEGYRFRFKDLYVNYSDAENEHTSIFDQSGSFTGEFVFTNYTDKLNYESTPESSVYYKEAKSKVFTVNNKEPDTKGNIDIPISHLSGKTLVCFGDSITGMFAPPTDYPSVIARITGMTVYNVGMEGCRMSHHPDQYYDAFSMTQLIDGIFLNDFGLQEAAVGHTAEYAAERVATLKSIDWNNVDFISVFYGTNDIQGGIPLEDDNGNASNESYLGAARYCLETLWKVYPNIKVLFVTPIFRYWDDPVINSDSKTFGNNNFYDFTNGLLDVAKTYKTPALDLYYTSGINELTCEYYFLPNDGTHPNDIGRELIGSKIAAKLLSEF